MRPKKQLLSVTPRAVVKIKSLLASREKKTDSIRVYVKSGGCSGFSYRIEFVDNPDAKDEIIEVEDIKVYVESMAVMFLVGSVMDYTEDVFKSGFSFENPNEKGRCGCGESFRV